MVLADGSDAAVLPALTAGCVVVAGGMVVELGSGIVRLMEPVKDVKTGTPMMVASAHTDSRKPCVAALILGPKRSDTKAGSTPKPAAAMRRACAHG